MSWRKRIALAALALVVLALFALAFRPQPQPVDTVAAAREALTVTVVEQGVTRVVDRFVVSTPVAGLLERVALRPGDRVERGEPVARVHPLAPQPLDARQRAEATARVRQARAAEAAARQRAQSAAAAAELAQSQFRRSERQHARGDIPQAALEQARAALLQAQAAVRAARFELESARFQREAAQALLELAEQESAGVIELPAPVSGQVLTVRQQSETAIGAGQPVLDLAEPSALEVAVDVLSSDAVRIRPGMRVLLERWGGEPLEAAVRRVEPGGFTKVSALGVEEQRVLVIVDLLAPPAQWQRLGDAYRVLARFELAHREDVLQVPEGAVFRRGEGWAVFIVEDGRARLRPVRLGQRAQLRVEIVEGLAAGERVIVHPDAAVEDGSRVVERRGAGA